MIRRFLATAAIATIAAAAAAQGGKTETYNGLQMTIAGVSHDATASLRDCPPGTNTVHAETRPGETFALVTVAFKVPSGFKSEPMKRPTVTDAAGKTYHTSVQFVDVGSVPEYSCTFPFRVPSGTKLKSFAIETATFDLSGLDK